MNVTPRNLSVEKSVSDNPDLDLWVKRFFQLPLIARITIWMIGAWLCAVPLEWVVSNYRFESCLMLLPAYAGLGAIVYLFRLSCRFVRLRLHSKWRQSAVLQPMRALNQNLRKWLGITL